MKLKNLSAKKMSDLRPLITFVEARCKHLHLAELVISRTGIETSMAGWAWEHYGNDPFYPSRIEIIFGCDDEYPKHSIHRKSAPAPPVFNWKEEFVHVLAHEARHIDQFWTRDPVPRQFEVDAERFANATVLEYRNLIYSSNDSSIYRTQTQQTRRLQRQPHSRNRTGSVTAAAGGTKP